MPNAGYGSNKKTKHMLRNGFLKFSVNNAKVKFVGSHNCYGLISHVKFS